MAREGRSGQLGRERANASSDDTVSAKAQAHLAAAIIDRLSGLCISPAATGQDAALHFSRLYSRYRGPGSGWAIRGYDHGIINSTAMGGL
jgi:hypothetical protein